MDHTYNVHNFSDKWTVGNSMLEINQDDDHFSAEKRYKGTTGVYELLFMKHSNVYDKNYLAGYKSILRDTNDTSIIIFPVQE